MKNLSISFFFLSILLFAKLTFGCYLFSSPPSLKDFTLEEKEKLNLFLNDLFKNRSLGYSIFGNKPICWEPFCSIEECALDDFIYADILLCNEALPGIRKLACDTKKFRIEYRLIEKEGDEYPSHDFSIINKPALKKVIKKNLPLFREKIGLKLTTKQIYHDILNNKASYLYNQPALDGILLGYGAENSIMWAENNAFINEVQASVEWEYIQNIEDEEQAKNEWLKVLKDYGTAHLDKWGEYQKKSEKYTNLHIPELRINFACFPDSKETQLIIKDYKKAEKKMKATLQMYTPLEALLNAF